jgi:hypothetical protein
MFVDSPVNGRMQKVCPARVARGRLRFFSYQMSRFPIEIFEKISTITVCEGKSFTADEI